MPDLDTIIGERVRAERERRGWTLTDLLRKTCAADASTLSLKERGMRRWTAAEVVSIAAAFGCSVDSLVTSNADSETATAA